jgi:death-on-curing protein
VTPTFLIIEEVQAIHANQLQLYGGTDGLRDAGLLRSALVQPETSFGGQWLHEDLPAMAAAYMLHLAQNHPFVDGNKRVAAVCGLHFLHLNGQSIEAAPEAFADLVLAVDSGKAGKDDLATWLRAHQRAWRPSRSPGP